MKLKSKTVLQGFTLKGEIKKGDKVRINVGGVIKDFNALDVVPAGTDPFEKSSFFDKIGTNVHKHRIDEDDCGWIIIDTEEFSGIRTGEFAAAFK